MLLLDLAELFLLLLGLTLGHGLLSAGFGLLVLLLFSLLPQHFLLLACFYLRQLFLFRLPLGSFRLLLPQGIQLLLLRGEGALLAVSIFLLHSGNVGWFRLIHWPGFWRWWCS